MLTGLGEHLSRTHFSPLPINDQGAAASSIVDGGNLILANDCQLADEMSRGVGVWVGVAEACQMLF